VERHTESVKLGLPSLAILTLLACSCTHADELTLKDGTKIVGTIVGFEEDSFRVKTSYGFAVVQKDQVASINISDVGKPETGKSPAIKKIDPEPAAETPKIPDAAGAKSAATPATAQSPPSALAIPPSSPTQKAASTASSAPIQIPVAAKPRRSEVSDLSSQASAAKSSNGNDKVSARAAEPAPGNKIDVANSGAAQPTVAANPASPSTAVLPHPPVAIEPIREEVIGNTYTNETYSFQMYKPPTWRVIAGMPALLPGAIAAMGTDDQTTYLLVGQESAESSIEKVRDAAQRRLRDIMNNYRALGEASLAVSGERAIEIRFRGGVDERDWSGVAVFIPHGARLFTIFGMTIADSDLVQIQENVIARAISSLQFTK
jgi:hypothetical protein